MSWTLSAARRSGCFGALRLMQYRPHVRLPPISLTRSYSSDTADITSSRHKPYSTRTIQTLDPSRLRSSDFMDVSFAQYTRLCIGNQDPVALFYLGGRRIPFPDGTRGFLYYHSPGASVPPAAGELRFRLTSGNDPASFIQGNDLRMPNGLGWGIPLLTILHHRAKRPIKQQLLDDGLVTPALLETCTAMLDANKRIPVRGNRIIHSFGQLFHVNFDAINLLLYTLTMNQLHLMVFFRFFGSVRQKLPYSGSALCCFERSSLPQHQGTRTVVIRIVKITSPVTRTDPNDKDPIPLPAEGELARRICRGRIIPASFNVDTKAYAGLKMLFQDES